METTQQNQSEASYELSPFTGETIFICYAVATFAASVATFGEGGVAFGMIVPTFWAFVFGVRSCFLRATSIVALAFVGMLLLLPPLDSGPGHRDATWRMSCSNNLKGIALALHNYHDVYKTFPPAYIKGPNGRRMHSWRVLILPYLEADTCQSLYDAYNFDEPWDGPNNRELALQMPQVFCCPSQCKRGSKPTGLTNYFAVVGENTAWPGEQAIGFRDIIDGSSNTLLLLEVANRPITWTEPTDIEFAEATDILMRREFAPHGYEDFFHDRKLGGCQIALADGSVRFVAQQADDVASKLLIRRNDGEHFDLDSLQKNAAAPMPLRVGNRIRLGVIVLLALGPFPWVWIKPSQRIAPATDQND